jgi:hypothetical protein
VRSEFEGSDSVQPVGETSGDRQLCLEFPRRAGLDIAPVGEDHSAPRKAAGVVGGLYFEVDVNVTVLLATVVSDAANDTYVWPFSSVVVAPANSRQPAWFVLAEKVTACDNR